ncbi:MAG: tyrosine-type recombinase/integrase, partial [Pirellulales bacterium]
MARKKGVPSYRFHKARNCAVVTIDGRNRYLGPYDSPESYEKYARLLAEWKTRQIASIGPPTESPACVSVNDLILAFWKYAEKRYVKNGKPTSEKNSFRTALRPVRVMYGRELVTNFGPLALTASRQKLIDAGICRKRINQHVTRVRQVFKWGVAREMVPETVWRALCAVEGLRHGEAVETEPIKPAPEDDIQAIQPFVTPQIRAMVNLQLWSACRPGEACLMRAIDINTQGPIW